MQAIITKYVPPTNHKPGRVKATCERGSLTVSWDHGLEIGDNHRAACDALCAKFDMEDFQKYGARELLTLSWSRPKASGQIPSGEYVFCFIPERVYSRGDAKLVRAARNLLAVRNDENRDALKSALEGLT